MKKYEFTGETKQISTINGPITLHRIKASVAFGNIKSGDIGGWIEKKENLSHDGNAWVYGNAQVYGAAWVYGDAQVYGNAQVYGDAQVYGNACVYDNARVFGDAQVYGAAQVYGNACVYGNAYVYDNARVFGDAQVYGAAWVYGDAQVYDDAQVYSIEHVLLVGLIGSRNDYTTFFRNQNGGISVSCGCFLGEIDKFIEKVIETHGENKHASVYRAAVELAKLQIGLE